MEVAHPDPTPSPVTPRGYYARIIAIDLSLTSTGMATIYPDGKMATGTITTKGKRGETITERCARIRYITGEVGFWLATTSLIVIEGPAGAVAGGSTWDRAGLWWAVVDRAMRLGPVAVVSPPTRARWATGNGRADKAAVAVAIARRAPDVDLSNSDEADALALAWMGAQWLGWQPVRNKVEQAALDAAKWPEVRS